jgi:hypothetical protein
MPGADLRGSDQGLVGSAPISEDDGSKGRVRMASARKRSPASDSAQQEIREQEVLRANRELAAYFKGRRTEREARAALKIIRAFIRDREDLEPAVRRPLPGVSQSAKAAPNERPRKRTNGSGKRRRKKSSKRAVDPDLSTLPESESPAPEADTELSD